MKTKKKINKTDISPITKRTYLTGGVSVSGVDTPSLLRLRPRGARGTIPTGISRVLPSVPMRGYRKWGKWWLCLGRHFSNMQFNLCEIVFYANLLFMFYSIHVHVCITFFLFFIWLLVYIHFLLQYFLTFTPSAYAELCFKSRNVM